MNAVGHPAEKKTVPYGTGRRYQSRSPGTIPNRTRPQHPVRAGTTRRRADRHTKRTDPRTGRSSNGFASRIGDPARGCYGAAAWTSAIRSLASDVRFLIVALLGAGPPWASPFNRVRIWPAIWSRFASQEPSFASAAT